MSKLHEVIAVEATVKKTSRDCFEEAMVTFSKRKEHFEGHKTAYQPFDEQALDAFEDYKLVDTGFKPWGNGKFNFLHLV